MIKNLISLCIFSVLLASCNEDPEISKSQEDFQLKVFGGSATDCCYAIHTDGDNLFLTGSLDYQNGPDMFLIKTDRYGNGMNWSPKLFGTSGTEIGYDIGVDSKQNIIMVGSTLASGSQTTDVFVAKTNANGDELWRKRIGGPSNEVGYALNTSSPNSIFIAGYTEGVSFDFKRRQGWLLALSENGDSLWSQDFGTSFVPDELSSITDMRDSLLLMGSTQSLFGNFKQDVFLFILKKSTRGIENSVTLFRVGNETGVSVIYNSAEGIFVLGYTQVSPTVNNIIVWKLGDDLQVRKEQQLTSSISETPSALAFANGTLAVIGTVKNEQGNEDYLTYTLDTNLAIVSRNVYGSADNQRGLSGTIMGRSIVIGGCSVSENASRATLFKTPEILP